jgi:hypothetical protein
MLPPSMSSASQLNPNFAASSGLPTEAMEPSPSRMVLAATCEWVLTISIRVASIEGVRSAQHSELQSHPHHVRAFAQG